MTNSRNKGAAFEREIANLLNEEFSLSIPLKRILEQTREKFLPDLILGRWHLECKRYGQGNEPIEKWWSQVIKSTKKDGIPALIYKFNNRPIKVKVPLYTINPQLEIINENTCDLFSLIKNFSTNDVKKSHNDLWKRISNCIEALI